MTVSDCMGMIRERISRMEDGAIFTISEFEDLDAEKDNLWKSLSRLAAEGTVDRVVPGIYAKPRYSDLLKEYVPPHPNDVARVLARYHHWTIAPTGVKALNMLGLSTQVPAGWVYDSTGPGHIYRWSGVELEFRHKAIRELEGLSFISVLVFQALKITGRNRVTEKTTGFLAYYLSRDEKRTLLRESSHFTAKWIRDAVAEICRD